MWCFTERLNDFTENKFTVLKPHYSTVRWIPIVCHTKREIVRAACLRKHCSMCSITFLIGDLLLLLFSAMMTPTSPCVLFFERSHCNSTLPAHYYGVSESKNRRNNFLPLMINNGGAFKTDAETATTAVTCLTFFILRHVRNLPLCE